LPIKAELQAATAQMERAHQRLNRMEKYELRLHSLIDAEALVTRALHDQCMPRRPETAPPVHACPSVRSRADVTATGYISP
jgi:hypothetical protein